MSPIVDGADVTDEELTRARRYPMTIAWSEDNHLFLASFPDVPGIVTHGTTPEEAARHGDEIVVIWLTTMLDAGYEIPEPSVTARGVAG